MIVRVADPLAGDVFEAGNRFRGKRCLAVTGVPKTHDGQGGAGQPDESTHCVSEPLTLVIPKAESSPRPRFPSQGPATEERVIEHQQDDSPDNGDEHAVEIEARHSLVAKDRGEHKAPDKGPGDPQHDIEENAFACLVDDLAGDEAGNEAQNEPADDGHGNSDGGEVTVNADQIAFVAAPRSADALTESTRIEAARAFQFPAPFFS